MNSNVKMSYHPVETHDPKTNLFIAGGNIYYWGGSGKPPAYLPSPQNFHPTERVKSVFQLKEMMWFDHDRPYLPLIPKFNPFVKPHVAFDCLSFKNGLISVVEMSVGRWRLDPITANKWDVLERWLRDMLVRLLKIGQPPGSVLSPTFSLWPYPARYRYKGFEGEKETVLYQVAQSREAFLPLIAACTLAICWCRRREQLDPNFDFSNEMDRSALKAPKQHISWIHNLVHSFAGEQDVERVGMILRLDDSRTPDIFRLFRGLNMPICFHLGSVGMNSLRSPLNVDCLDLYSLIPSSNGIVSLNDLHLKRIQSNALGSTLYSETSKPMTILDDIDDIIKEIPIAPGSGQRSGERVEDFMKRRTEVNELRARSESERHRNARLARKKQVLNTEEAPGHGKEDPLVWLWEKQEDGYDFRVRQLVPRGQVPSVWLIYSNEQKIYDSWANCWDICSDFGADSEEEHHFDVQEYEDEGQDEVFSNTAEFGEEYWGAQEAHIETSCESLAGAPYNDNDREDGEVVDASGVTIPLPWEQRPEQDAFVHPSADEVSKLISGDEIFAVEMEFTETILDIAYARYGFTDDPFELITETVPWNDSMELLGNGRWLNNPDNSRFLEEETKKEKRKGLESFFSRLRSVDVSNGINIPSLDLITRGTEIRVEDAWSFNVVLRKFPDGIRFHITSRTGGEPFDLLLYDPVAILQIVRCRWGPNLADIAGELLYRGIRFQTLFRGPPPRPTDKQCTTDGLGSRGPRLGHRPESYAPDVNDFFAYEAVRNEFLRSERGRAAVMAGGLIGRIALEVVTEEAVVYGPDAGSILQSGSCIFEDSGIGFWDQSLTEEEIDLICGVYYVKNRSDRDWGDKKYASSHKSWFPRPGAFNAGSLNVGFWSKDCEKWYQRRLMEIRSGKAQLMNASRWRSAMQFNHRTPRIVDKNQEVAHLFLKSRCPLV
ncbi:hypothetical protein L218DRAFT_916545 [Marasmius fiardii PR-910]|nr:hypothetical protein L218DRAFT_916545 [Marasmius fiardii PR-910]